MTASYVGPLVKAATVAFCRSSFLRIGSFLVRKGQKSSTFCLPFYKKLTYLKEPLESILSHITYPILT
jgi:hypothetical protein